MKRRQNGFTLTELMIAVAILGILVAVAVPKFSDLILKAKEASIRAKLGSVRGALNIYFAGHEGDHAPTLEDAMMYAGFSMGPPPILMPAVSSNPGFSEKNSVYNASCVKFIYGQWIAKNKNSTAWVYDLCGKIPGFEPGEVRINWEYPDSKGQIWLNQ